MPTLKYDLNITQTTINSQKAVFRKKKFKCG